MAFTADQLTALEKAAASGQLRVQLGDKVIQYQTLTELMAVIRMARAKFVGAIYRETSEDNPISDQTPKEEDGRAYVDIEDGYMLQLGLNERATLESGDSGGSGLIDFLRTQLRAIAAGMGVPFELMTGDYSGTNDRIMRVILNTFYRRLEIQQDALVAQVLQPLWGWWLDAVNAAGLLPLRGYTESNRARRDWQRCEWRAHAWSYVNPLQEAQTTVLKIENGLTSRTAAVAESGWDAEDIDRQQALDRQRERDLGLRYGSPAPDPAPDPESEPTPDPESEPTPPGKS
ncbi:MAG: phage head-tail joining protein [Candidatus Competibacteraceae bacterium]